MEPPSGYRGKRAEDLPYYLDWAEYKEFQINEALRRLADIWRSLGVDLPTFQNIQSQNYTPIDLSAMEGGSCVDAAGIDMYPEPRTYRLIRDRAKYMAGTSRFPFIPEFGCGSWYERRKTLSVAEEEFTTLYAFMNGVRGINYYMLVERDRWQGSPITVDGRVRPDYFELYKSINAFLKEGAALEFQAFARSPPPQELRKGTLRLDLLAPRLRGALVQRGDKGPGPPVEAPHTEGSSALPGPRAGLVRSRRFDRVRHQPLGQGGAPPGGGD